jgi:anti-anti-sigma factor
VPIELAGSADDGSGPTTEAALTEPIMTRDDPPGDPTPASDAQLTARRRNMVVVAFRGEIDLASAGVFRDALNSAAADPGTRLLVCDLSQVTFLGAVGLTILSQTKERLDDRDATLRVITRRRNVVRVFAVTGLTRHLGVHSDLTDAVWDDADTWTGPRAGRRCTTSGP